MKKLKILLGVLIAALVFTALPFTGCTSRVYQDPASQDTAQDTAADTSSAPDGSGQDQAAAATEDTASAPPAEPVAAETDPWPPLIDSWQIAFGFADTQGRRLIYNTEEHDSLIENGFDPTIYSLAVGPYGALEPIAYSTWQDETQYDTFRQVDTNFKNLAGFVYSQPDWDLTKNKTYILTNMCSLIDGMVAMSPPGGRKGNTPAMPAETIDSIAAYKGRGVEWGKTLAVTKTGMIGLVKFERQGDDMLFSIVYMDEDTTLFWDCPAVYDEGSTWRVDSGDDPGDLQPLLFAHFDEGYMMVLTWGSAEGETILLLCEKDGAFAESDAVAYGRYWSPA